MNKNLTRVVFSTVALSLSLSSLAQQPEHKSAEASSTSLTALTTKDYQAVCSQQKALDLLAQEAADTLLSTAVFLEASTEAMLSSNLMSIEKRAQLLQQLRRRDKQFADGNDSIIAGTGVLAITGLTNISLFGSNFYDKKPMLRGTTSSALTVSTSTGGGLALAGLINWSRAMENKNQVQGNVDSFRNNAGAIHEFAEVFANTLQLSPPERRLLHSVLDREIEELTYYSILALSRDNAVPQVIDIIELARKNNIGNPDMLNALKKFSELNETAVTSPEDSTATRAVVSAQIKALRETIQAIVDQKGNSQFLSLQLQNVRAKTLESSRVKLRELEETLKAIPEDCKK